MPARMEAWNRRSPIAMSSGLFRQSIDGRILLVILRPWYASRTLSQHKFPVGLCNTRTLRNKKLFTQERRVCHVQTDFAGCRLPDGPLGGQGREGGCLEQEDDDDIHPSRRIARGCPPAWKLCI